MALETKLIQKLSQSLLMTPQLQQAIKLLQLGRLEYKEAIEKELLENPVLEELKDETDPAARAETASERDRGENAESSFDESTGSAGAGDGGGDEVSLQDPAATSATEKPDDWERYLDHYAESRSSTGLSGNVDYEDRPSLEATLTRDDNLTDHILSQIRLSDIPDHTHPILLYMVGNLNKDGYLCATFDEIAQACNSDVSTVESVHQIFHSLDPIGVGARDLRECLLIQLADLGLADALEARIVDKHLDKIERRRYDQIAKSENVEVEAVYRAVTTIQSLEPRPGRGFSDESTRYIVPDIFVQKVANDYVITLNEDGLPKLRVSPYYVKLLRSADQSDLPNKAYLTDRLKAATWLIKSIQQRQQTIYKVTESIVKFQREFFDRGIERLKPLVLKDVADDIGMHESTVSRVTTNKYVHTPQGVFELKFFFSSGIRTQDGDVSSSAIKERIKQILAAEAPAEPISDQQIVDLLKKENIDIARRTVAKYRESLGIPSSSRRKRLF